MATKKEEEEKGLEKSVEEPPLRLQILLGVGMSIIGIAGSLLAFLIATSVLGLREGIISLIAGFRVLLTLGCFTAFLPGTVFGEWWYSRWKKRPFRSRNIAIFCILSAESILVMMIIATVFEMFFPRLELVDQAPILGISVGAGIIAIALTSRIRRINEFLKKAFE